MQQLFVGDEKIQEKGNNGASFEIITHCNELPPLDQWIKLRDMCFT